MPGRPQSDQGPAGIMTSMEEIGRLLRETREKLGLTHEEVERATRIRTRYVEAMERGDLSSLPSSVQARGFLRNYSEYLGLDQDEVLLMYAEHLQGGTTPQRSSSNRTQRQSENGVRVQQPRWITTDLLVAMGIILAVLVVLVWGGSRLLIAVQQQSEASTEEVSGLNLISTASPTASPTATQASEEFGSDLPGQTPLPDSEATLPDELTGGEALEGGVNLRLLIERRAYLDVSVDGEPSFQGRAAPGDILEYRAEQLIRVVTGNGGGVRAVYNGQDQGRLGEIGEVVIRLWDLNGAITPTPTPSATPTPTEEITPTTTPTETPLP